jgi:hypothetical protein
MIFCSFISQLDVRDLGHQPPLQAMPKWCSCSSLANDLQVVAGQMMASRPEC